MNSLIMLAVLSPILLGAQDPGSAKPTWRAEAGRRFTVDLGQLMESASSATLLSVDDLLEVQDVPAQDASAADAKLTFDQRRERATVAFGAMLEQWMKPAFDAKIDKVVVLGPGCIQLVGSNEQIAWTNSFLALQRHWKDLVEVHVRIFDAPLGTFRRFGVEETTKTFDRYTEFDELLARAQSDPDVKPESSPRIVARARQKTYMSVGDPVSYVQEWRLQVVEPGPKTIAVPTIGIVQDGIVVEARAVPLEKYLVGLELSFTRSKLERPIPAKKMRLGTAGGQEVEIGLPVVNKVGLDTKVALLDNGSFVLVTASSDEGREIAVAVTLGRVRPDSEDTASPR
jgi:hypothetical protein